VDSGIVLAGRYRLDERLGHGGMGEVWGARDLRLGRDVAVKVLRDADPGEAEVRRFVREATVAAGLQHPGITVVFDADAHDGRLFIVTELLSGKDLGKVLAAHSGGLPLDRLLDFGIQLADALAAAHGRGIIHRDLKPTNLFVQADERLPNGRLKVCDFGLARDLTSSSRVTRAGEVFGTPAYMAPEQWSRAAVDPGADLYAVGCILYEMVTGRIPFEGPSMPAFMAQHLTQPPVPPHNLKPGIPAGLNDLVLSLLSKEAANRPPSASEVLAILTRLRDVRRQAPAPARRQAAPAKTPGIRVPSGLMRTLASHAKSRPIHTLTGHTDLVYAVAFSPDGSLLATSSYDRTARLWDIATGQTIRTLTGHGPMYQVAFSPDGALVATTGGNGPARLWDTASGGTLRTLTGGAHAVAFSPDGTLLAASSGGGRSAWLWDAATGQIVRTFTGHTGSVLAVAFSPDGILLATSGSDNTARLWDTTTGQTIRTLTGHTGRVNAVAFSPDGSLLATSGGRTIRLSDTVTGQTIHTLADHTGNVNAVAFSPDGTLLAVGGGRTARLWVLG
jgi:serine/threonine protein kinase